jgi:hypothetical protein
MTLTIKNKEQNKMAERGKILRDTNAGEGIIFVNGVQKIFTLEKHWRSGEAPKVGQAVEVTLNAEGNIDSVVLVDESQLAKEQAQKALEAAKARGREGANALVAMVGVPTLVAIGLLTISWFFLSTITIQLTASSSEGVTFWDLLKVVNNGIGLQMLGGLNNSGTGFYGFLAIAALLAPLVPHFYQHKYSPLGYVAPLAYQVILVASAYFNFKNQFSKTADMSGSLFGAQGAEYARKMADEMITQAMNAIHLGAGFYLALIISVYLALIGIKKFLAAKALAV